MDLLDDADRERLLKGAFCFGIVRDPTLRLVSAFVSKFVLRGAMEFSSRPVVERVQCRPGRVLHDGQMRVRSADSWRMMPVCSRVDYERGISFRQFITYLDSMPNKRINQHFRPQADFLTTIRVDWLGQSEHLSWCLGQVRDRLALRVPVPRDRPQRARRPGGDENLADVPSGELRKRGLAPGAADLLDPQIRQIITRRFAKDVALHQHAEHPET